MKFLKKGCKIPSPFLFPWSICSIVYMVQTPLPLNTAKAWMKFLDRMTRPWPTCKLNCAKIYATFFKITNYTDLENILFAKKLLHM